MPARDGVLHEVGPDEPRASENEEVHGRTRSLGRSGIEEAGRGCADEHGAANGGRGLEEVASAGHRWCGDGWRGVAEPLDRTPTSGRALA
jgi:hypothetical protein